MARVTLAGALFITASAMACDPTLLLNEFCATDDDCTDGQCDARGVCSYDRPLSDAGPDLNHDSGTSTRVDGGPPDGDAGPSAPDAGNRAADAGAEDAGTEDAGTLRPPDGGPPAPPDGGPPSPPDGGPPPSPDAGATDAGPSSWHLVDNDAVGFGAGSSTQTIFFMDALQLGPGLTDGVFDSRPLVTGTQESELRVVTATTPAPFGQPLPDNVLDNEDVVAWNGNGFDMTDAVILLHFDRPLHETVSAFSTADDTTGYEGQVSFVDNPPLENSQYEGGPLHHAVHIAYEDYFVLDDSDDAPRWAFGTGGFTWALWMKADGCENSEKNVIALGGETPHMWLGALCPSGNAQFRVASGTSALSSVYVVDNAWHHLAGVFDPTLALPQRLYVDGALVAESAGSAGDADNFSKKLFLGNFPIGTPPLYTYKSDVVIDELVVLRRSLSPNEIAHLFLRGGSAIRFQVEVCATPASCLGTFFGPDLTASSFYDAATHVLPGPAGPFVLSPGIPGSVFRYRATFHRFNTVPVPALSRVTLDAALP